MGNKEWTGIFRTRCRGFRIQAKSYIASYFSNLTAVLDFWRRNFYFSSAKKKKKEKIRQYIRDIRENRLRGGINSVVLSTECWLLYVAFVIS